MRRTHQVAATIGVCLGLILAPPAQALIDQGLDPSVEPTLPNAIAVSTTSLEQSATVRQLVFSPDSRYLLIADANQTVRIWDVAHRREASRFSYATGQDVLAVVFSPNAQYVATVNQNDTVSIWAVQQGVVVAEFPHKRGYAIAFSPDSQFIATLTGERDLHVWEIASQQKKLHFQHEDTQKLTFSAKGRYLAATSSDAVIQIFDLQSGRPSARLDLKTAAQDQRQYIQPPIFSPDERQIAVADYSGMAQIWDVEHGELLFDFSRSSGSAAYAIAYSPDGRYFVTAGREMNYSVAYIWDTQSGQEVTSIFCKTDTDTVSFSPDSRYLAITGSGQVKVWDFQRQQEIARLGFSGSPFRLERFLTFSPDSRYVAVVKSDQEVQIWDRYGTPLLPFYHEDTVSAATFNPNGRHVATGSRDGFIRIWDRQSGELLMRRHQYDQVLAMALSPDGRHLAVGSYSQLLWLWNVEKPEGTALQEYTDYTARVEYEGVSWGVAFSPDGNYLATVGDSYLAPTGGSAEGFAVRIWAVRPDSETVLTEVKRIPYDTEAYDPMFSPDGRSLLVLSRDGTVRIWDVENGQEKLRLSHPKGVSTAQFSPDGHYIVTASSNDTARIWHASSGQEIAQLRHEDGVRQAIFSADGRYVATASWDGTARVWQAASGEEVAKFRHEGGVLAIAFSPDGQLLATGSRDDTARVWDIASQQEMGRFTHAGDVVAIAFSPDGQQILSSSDDQTAQLWTVPSVR